MSDPLSPEALAQVPEVRNVGMEYRNRVADLFACPEPLLAEMGRRSDEAFHALLLAVRDATLSAERSRLLALTPEETVGRVAETALRDMAAPTCYAGCDCARCFGLRLKAVRAALPILLAPEVARREEVEKRLNDLAVRFNDREGTHRAELERLREQIRVWEQAADGTVLDAVRLRVAAQDALAKEVAKREAVEKRLADTERWVADAQARLLTGDNSAAYTELVSRLAAVERERDHNEGAVHITRQELRAAEAERDRMRKALAKIHDRLGVGASLDTDLVKVLRAALGGSNG